MTGCPFTDLIFEALCAHEAFRKLGFSPDDIYFRPRHDKLFVTVQRGGKEFNFDVGPHQRTMHALIEEWKPAAKWWNEHPDREALKAMYEQSNVRRNVVGLIAALHAKGFAVKRSDA